MKRPLPKGRMTLYIEFDKKVEAALKGDNKAKEWIINSLKPLVTSYSKKYGWQNGWNDELYQEGALQILEALNDFEPNKKIPFLGFVSIRIKHYYQNKRRKNKPTTSLNQSIVEGDTVSILDMLVDEKICIDMDYIKEEDKKNLILAIDKLEPLEKEIIEEYYLKENMLKNIAKNKNLHYVTVAKRKGKALDKLKKALI